MSYKQGDIVIVPFPFTDLTSSKVRPAIVVSNDLVNKSNDIILAQITKQHLSGSLALKITNSDVNIPFKSGLSKMYISCKKIAVIEKSLIHKKITTLNELKTNETLIKIKSIFNKE